MRVDAIWLVSHRLGGRDEEEEAGLAVFHVLVLYNVQCTCIGSVFFPVFVSVIFNTRLYLYLYLPV